MHPHCFLLALFAPYVAALPQTSGSQCSTGSLQCCNSVVAADSPEAKSLLATLGITPDAGVDVGINCSPISATSVGGATCAAQAACCSGPSSAGIVELGCVPADLS